MRYMLLQFWQHSPGLTTVHSHSADLQQGISGCITSTALLRERLES